MREAQHPYRPADGKADPADDAALPRRDSILAAGEFNPYTRSAGKAVDQVGLRPPVGRACRCASRTGDQLC